MTAHRRLVWAAAIGLLAAGYVALVVALQPSTASPDFYLWWVAARDWRMGADPYATTQAAGWKWPFYYPGTTVLLTVPFTWLSPPAAWAVFEGLGAGLLAWTVSRAGSWRLLICASGAFVMTLYFGQCASWLIAAVLTPWLAGLLTFKPSLGLALGVTHLSRRAVASVLVVLAASLAIYPDWFRLWLQAIHSTPDLVAPVLRPGGFLLLLALLRWRQPAARLLLAMACVPHTTLIHETLPLGLIPGSRNEMRLFAGSTLVAALAQHWAPDATWSGYLAWNWWWVGGLAYLPMLVLVLRRPNQAP